MSEDNKALLRHITNMSNKELVEVNYEDYREEVVELAKEELKKRNLDRVYLDKDSSGNLIRKKSRPEKPEYTTLGELVPQSDFLLVQKELLKCFPKEIENMDLYEGAFETLRALKPLEEAEICIRFSARRRNSEKELDWDVVGEDLGTRQYLGIEFCRWNEWLSYKVDKWELAQIGTDRFLALCLWKMTSNGFAEEDIQGILDTIHNDGFLTEQAVKAEMLWGANPDGDKVKKSDWDKQPHPWLRYFARGIDSALITYLFMVILGYFYTDYLGHSRDIVYKIALYGGIFIMEILIEGLLLSTWGTTIGKWIFNIRVRDTDNNIVSYNTALKRGIHVYFYGRGLGIPIVASIAGIISYERLMNKKMTKWDEDCKTRIIHGPIGVLRGVLAIALYIATQYCVVYLT